MDQALRLIVLSMDTNGDGLITHQEFTSFYSRGAIDASLPRHRDNNGGGDGVNFSSASASGGGGGGGDNDNGDGDADELGVIWLQLRGGIDSEFASEEDRSDWLQELHSTMTMTPFVCATTESFAHAIEQVQSIRTPSFLFVHRIYIPPSLSLLPIPSSSVPLPLYLLPLPLPLPSSPVLLSDNAVTL